MIFFKLFKYWRYISEAGGPGDNEEFGLPGKQIENKKIKFNSSRLDQGQTPYSSISQTSVYDPDHFQTDPDGNFTKKFP